MARFLKIFLCAGILFQTACSLEEPTWVSPAKVEVQQESFTDTFDTAGLDKATLHAIGVNYYRYGNGPMKIAVSYDPKSRVNTAQQANAQAGRIGTELSNQGVKNLKVATTSAPGTGDKSSTLISFPALTAKAPDSCGTMPGLVDAQTSLPNTAEGQNKGYQIGCTIESMMAQQVVRPGDLLGRPGFESNADARRQEAVIWQRGYYAPTSFPPLSGETASGSAQGK